MLSRWKDACSGSKKSRVFLELSRRGTVVFLFDDFIDLIIFNFYNIIEDKKMVFNPTNLLGFHLREL